MTQPLSQHPDIEAFRLMRAGRLAEALPFAERAVSGRRVCLPVHGMLATILLQLGRRRDAESVVSQALEHREGTADAYDALGHVSMLLGRHERSNALYRRAVTLAPRDPRFWYNLASSERSLGRLVEAEAACDRAIALDKGHYASYLLRSELRVQSQEDNHTVELKIELSRRELKDRARMLLSYALAKELDDLGRFDEAFQWLSQAATLRRRQLAYDVAVDLRKLRRIAEVFSTTDFHEATGLQDSSRYIFIVGLPRSGTTLLEHILTGLPGVRSNGETDNFARALLAAIGSDRGDVFASAAATDPTVVAANYARFASDDAREEKVIEKLPMNYLYLGAIRRALPNSKLLLVKREPVDSCFAMYRTLFGEAYPFSYDFEDLAKYYASYARLMDHWRECFTGTLHEVEYEDLVTKPALVGAGVAKHCDLEWSAQAIEVHKRATVSLTASAAQVRRPIYGSSAGRWRKYRAHLQPLVDALRAFQVAVPDDV